MRQQSVPAVGAARATSAELTATGRLAGVTAAAGPFGEATVEVQFGGQPLGSTLSVTGAPGAPALTVALRAE